MYYNIFTPFVLTLSFFNNGALWMGETFLPLYFYTTEKVFIPPLQNSVNYNKIWPFIEMVTYPELHLDHDLINFSNDFARSIPDFKSCFPEVRKDIVDLCSGDSTFISEYQYSVMALRILNCLHHRSLGIEEIDFEFIDQDYMMYLAMMTPKERILYQKMYNVARGLCLNEKRDTAITDVYNSALSIDNTVERYLNQVQAIKTYFVSLTRANIQKTKKNKHAHDAFINETQRLLQRVQQKYKEKNTMSIQVIKNVIEESNFCRKSVKTSLNVVAKNFKEIGMNKGLEESFKQLWYNFAREYGRKNEDMERKIASIKMKLEKIYKNIFK